jgi:hypothetical protein
MNAGEELNKLEDALKLKEWTYIEDIALSMPETAAEYRELLMRKGKDEIDKRKFFLLSTGSVVAPPPATTKKEEADTKMEIA